MNRWLYTSRVVRYFVVVIIILIIPFYLIVVNKQAICFKDALYNALYNIGIPIS